MSNGIETCRGGDARRIRQGASRVARATALLVGITLAILPGPGAAKADEPVVEEWWHVELIFDSMKSNPGNPAGCTGNYGDAHGYCDGSYSDIGNFPPFRQDQGTVEWRRDNPAIDDFRLNFFIPNAELRGEVDGTEPHSLYVGSLQTPQLTAGSTPPLHKAAGEPGGPLVLDVIEYNCQETPQCAWTFHAVGWLRVTPRVFGATTSSSTSTSTTTSNPGTSPASTTPTAVAAVAAQPRFTG